MTWKEDNWQRALHIAALRRQNYDRGGGRIHRELSAHQMEIGVLGEIKFEEITGWQMDDQYHAGGDQGWDFDTPLGTIDVKTFRKPFNLPVEIGKVKADGYVLAGYDGSDIKFWGWASRHRVNSAQKSYLPGNDILSHIIHRDFLTKMSVLLSALEAAKQFTKGTRWERTWKQSEPATRTTR